MRVFACVDPALYSCIRPLAQELHADIENAASERNLVMHFNEGHRSEEPVGLILDERRLRSNVTELLKGLSRVRNTFKLLIIATDDKTSHIYNGSHMVWTCSPSMLHDALLAWLKELVYAETFVSTLDRSTSKSNTNSTTQVTMKRRNAQLCSDKLHKCRRGASDARPFWDKNRRELWYKNTLVKSFHRSAPVAELILNAFEEQAWTDCIDDPLPPLIGVGQANRLRHQVQALNRRLDNARIRFFMDGTGKRLGWKPIPLVSQSRTLDG